MIIMLKIVLAVFPGWAFESINGFNKSSNMRKKVKDIALKAINQEITEIEAEQQLLLLFNIGGSKSNEANMPPLKKKRIYKILEADGNACFYCGIETHPVNGDIMYNSSTVDHVLPKSKGGIDHIDNCVNSCNNCNNLKGSDRLLPPTPRETASNGMPFARKLLKHYKTYYMIKHKVNIDLSSIKKNKGAGTTTTIVPARKIVTFSVYKLPEYFKDGENCIITEWSVIKVKLRDLKGVITSDDLIQKCIKEKHNISISVDFENKYIDHFPIPEYYYDYENTRVTCNNCGKQIFTKDLESHDFWDGEAEYYSHEICPECGSLDCCNLVYESIEDALFRINKEPKIQK
jgi:5-methylcytosine-specific restriction endonuclease McrA